MKIGVLTYHKVVNLGATLQAVSVVELLREAFPGAEVEIIDYAPWSVIFKELRKCISLRNLSLNTNFIKRMNILRRYIKRYGLSRNKCRSGSNSRAASWLSKQGYDLIVVGSDTVWEVRDPGYAPRGVNLYFLPLGNNVIKVGFCVSSDPINHSNIISNKEIELRARAINQFDIVFYRDKPSRVLWSLAGVDGLEVHDVFDPVLLAGIADHTGSDSVEGISDTIKVAALSIGDPFVRDNVSRNLLIHEIDVIDLNFKIEYGYSLPEPNSVKDLLLNHRLSDILITDRFHASIFTLLQSDSCILAFEDPTKWDSENSKLRDLFSRLGLEDFVFRDLSFVSDKEKIDSLYELWKEKLPSMRSKVLSISTTDKNYILAGLRNLIEI